MTRYMDEVAEIEGIETSNDAMAACGMQPEFAAHMVKQNEALGVSLILRAGSPPVYNQKRGPKTGFNLTKTSNHGLFRGSLAADKEFTRVDPKTRQPAGHKEKDEIHLAEPITHINYQHTVALPVTMQDILRELGPKGDLNVLGYDESTQLLRLAYKPGKGSVNFQGQFVINLGVGKDSPMFYSRPWDKPSHLPSWDPKTKTTTKPESLDAVPNEVFQRALSQTFDLKYTDNKSDNPLPLDIKEAKVFANTPRTSIDLLNAIKDSGLIEQDTPRAEFFAHATERTSREEMLNQLSEEEIRVLYDQIGLVTTGDWDGLAIGISTKLLEGFPEATMRVYNTFSQADAAAEIEGLMRASIEYFNHLKQLPMIQGTPVHDLLKSIDDPRVLFSEFALQRAGCITPHEFLYQQLINYTHRDEINNIYGNDRGRAAVQAGVDAGIAYAKVDTSIDPKVKFENCLKIASDAYHEEAKKGEFNSAWQKIDEEHLENHLKIALDLHQDVYPVPNVDHDHNVHDLFQHGFDVRNPYGESEDGPWLMITDNGGVIYGKNQDLLIKVLLVGDFLKDNIITVPPGYKGADMQAGWGKVVERQLSLQAQGFKQDIPAKTIENYNEWRRVSQSMKEVHSDLEARVAPVDPIEQMEVLEPVEVIAPVKRSSIKERLQSFIFSRTSTSAPPVEKEDLKEGSSHKLGGGS